MKFNRTVSMVIAGLFLSGGDIARVDAQEVHTPLRDVLEAGLYAIDFRLELPHLERYAVNRTATVCIAPGNLTGATPLPVLSGNGAFDACSATNVARKERRLAYDIACAGRAAARASATYSLSPARHDRFRGRIEIVLGAKNMTMTEVQNARRIGHCDVAGIR